MRAPLPRAVLCLLVLCICGGCVERAPAGDDTVRLTFSFWALDTDEINDMQMLAGNFTALHPGVEVQVREVSGRYYEKLTTQFAAGNPPDVMVINYGRLGDFTRRGVLADLQVINAPMIGSLRSEMLPVAFDSLLQVGKTVGRRGLYALPLEWNPSNLMVYDPDILAAAGIAVSPDGWTWDEFAAALPALSAVMRNSGTDDRGHAAAVCLYPYAVEAWFAQAGGGAVAADGSAVTLASPANSAALKFLHGLVQAGHIAPPDPARDLSLEQFEAGNVALIFMTPYSLPRLLKLPAGRRFAVARPLRGTATATGCIPTTVAVSAACPHPQEAFAFAAFLVTEGARRRAAVARGFPSWLPALVDPLAEPAAALDNDTLAVLQEAAQIARPLHQSAHHGYETVQDALRQALEEVFLNDAIPHEALSGAENRLAQPENRL